MKNNLPVACESEFFTRSHMSKQRAKCIFLLAVLRMKMTHEVKEMFLRDEDEKPMRGYISVYVDGFLYHIELFHST